MNNFIEMFSGIGGMYESGMSQCEIAEKLGISQKTVCKFMKKNGIPSRKAVKRNQRGEQNDSWKGGKVQNKGYVLVRDDKHPRSVYGYVYEHILVAEKILGRNLLYYSQGSRHNEIVHHLNHNKKDNSPENLRVMTQGEHIAMHNRFRKRVVLTNV